MSELPLFLVGLVIFGGGVVAGLVIAALVVIWATADLADRPGKY